jgi:hypothetical protein
MTAKRFAIVATCLWLGLMCLFLVWAVRATPRKQTGGLSVAFAGLTNDAAGGTLAQFKVANTFSRRVAFGIGEVQVRQTNGWPDWMRVVGGAAWIPVRAGSDGLFSVSTRSLEGVTWRVPLMYSVDLSFIEDLRFRIDGLAWSIPRWRPSQPPPVRHGDAYHRSFFVYGPEMMGLSNPPVQRTEASRSAEESNQISGAAVRSSPAATKRVHKTRAHGRVKYHEQNYRNHHRDHGRNPN